MEVQSIVFNVQEAAQYLALPVSKIYELCNKRKLGAKKFGKNWPFLKKRLMHFSKTQRK